MHTYLHFLTITSEEQPKGHFGSSEGLFSSRGLGEVICANLSLSAERKTVLPTHQTLPRRPLKPEHEQPGSGLLRGEDQQRAGLPAVVEGPEGVYEEEAELLGELDGWNGGGGREEVV
jgi:hypothetical protein